MNSLLFNRSLGTNGPQALQRGETSRLIHALQAAPGVTFDGSDVSTAGPSSSNAEKQKDSVSGEVWAHRAGVNCLAIDKFEGRYMLSGGADSSIKLWDLELSETNAKIHTHSPIGKVAKTSQTHTFGITHLTFYPFDSLAFLSSSYDHALKIYSSLTLTPTASFPLSSPIYHHALSPIAPHLLVACATQHPSIRLVDLHSASTSHTLPGHTGAVFSVAWSPRDEHILASGGADGTVRFWDVRRSAGCLGVLDLEDSIGINGEDGHGTNARPRQQGKAHVGACNGAVWSDDGAFLITTGHDERVRVWDVARGANTLVHFGPVIRNSALARVEPLLVPGNVIEPGKGGVMFYPNEREVLMFELSEGRLLRRLRAAGSKIGAQPLNQAGDGGGRGGSSGGLRNAKNRVTSLAWRGAGHVEMYSGGSDGVVRAWMPRTKEEEVVEEEEEQSGDSGDGDGDGEAAERKRKRVALDEVFRDLTKRKITFT